MAILKGNILNSNLKFNFVFNEKVIKFTKIYPLDTKIYLLIANGLILIKPYLLFDTETELKNIVCLL